jgi:carbonic anhydrase/acetyltransferase-like protein (isoleucine patch superfamily)
VRRRGWIESLWGLLGRLKVRLFTFLVIRQFGSSGAGVIVCPPLRLANAHFIHLADGVTINRDCWIHVLSPEAAGPTPTLIIGQGCSIGMGATISAAREVVIGQRVMLARNVYISDHRHGYEEVGRSIADQGISGVKPTSIGDESWLGQNVCVLAGVRIGKHCVIGANSTVTTDLPDYSVAVGSPARMVKRYDFRSERWVSV